MKRVLVVAARRFESDGLPVELRELLEGGAEVRVVAPASRISRTRWLTNEEDRARLDAEATAAATSDRIDELTPPEVMVDNAGQGDVDPLRAIEDALAQFPADELVLLTAPDGAEDWLEKAARERLERAGVPIPITRLVLRERQSPVRPDRA